MSKKTIDKLSIISSIKPKVLRDGELITITPEEIVLDDILKFKTGNQVVVDSVIIISHIYYLFK